MHESNSEDRQFRRGPDRRSTGSSQEKISGQHRQYPQNYGYNQHNGHYSQHNAGENYHYNYHGQQYQHYQNNYSHSYSSTPHYYNNQHRGNHHRSLPSVGGQHYSGPMSYRHDQHTPLNNFNGSEIARQLTSNWTAVFDSMNNPNVPQEQKPVVAQVTPKPSATSNSPWGTTKHGCIANGQSLLTALRASNSS